MLGDGLGCRTNPAYALHPTQSCKYFASAIGATNPRSDSCHVGP